MEIPFEGAQRSEWKVSDRWKFFCDLESIFGRSLTTEDRCEIKLRLKANDPDYFELPIYDKNNKFEPAAIVIFTENKVLIDFIQPKKKEKFLSKIKDLVGHNIEISKWCDLTTRDWMQRLEVMDSLTTI